MKLIRTNDIVWSATFFAISMVEDAFGLAHDADYEKNVNFPYALAEANAIG